MANHERGPVNATYSKKLEDLGLQPDEIAKFQEHGVNLDDLRKALEDSHHSDFRRTALDDPNDPSHWSNWE